MAGTPIGLLLIITSAETPSGDMSGASYGTSTATGTLTGVGALAGSAAGTDTVSGTMEAIGSTYAMTELLLAGRTRELTILERPSELNLAGRTKELVLKPRRGRK